MLPEKASGRLPKGRRGVIICKRELPKRQARVCNLCARAAERAGA